MKNIPSIVFAGICFIFLFCNCGRRLHNIHKNYGQESFSVDYSIIEEPSDRTLNHAYPLQVVFGSTPRTLNPYRTINDVEAFLQKALFSTLFSMVPWSDFPRKNLVERYTVSSDGREYRFVLRNEIRFSDGTDLTSQDIVSSLGLLNGPLRQSSFAQQFYYSNRKLKVTAISDNEVSIILDEPNPHLLYALADFPIIPAATIQMYSDLTTDFNNLWQWPTLSVSGSGPYTLDSTKNDQIILIRNAYYFKRDNSGRRLPYSKKIIIRLHEKENKQILELANMRSDILKVTKEIEDRLDQNSTRTLLRNFNLVDTGIRQERTVILYNSYNHNPSLTFQNQYNREIISTMINMDLSDDYLLSSTMFDYVPVSSVKTQDKQFIDTNRDFRKEDKSGNTMFVKLVTIMDDPDLVDVAEKILKTMKNNNIDCNLTTIPQFKLLEYINGIHSFDIAIVPVKLQPGLYTTVRFLTIDSTGFTGAPDFLLPQPDKFSYHNKPLLWAAIQKRAIESYYDNINQLTPALFKKEQWFVNHNVHNFHNNATIEQGFSLQTLEYIFVE